MRIGVLFGGCSTEYSVSLQSAHAVIQHLHGHELVLLGITREGDWFKFTGDIDRIPADTWQGADCVPVVLSPSRSTHGIIELVPPYTQTQLDMVFPVLHGKNGEDGTVQGLVELAGIPLIGCDTECSALCMDKIAAHTLVRAAGVQTPRNRVYTRETLDLEGHGLRLPLFVKPVRSGSSFGVTYVVQQEELKDAVELAFQHDDRVILEEKVEGFEVGCAVLGNSKLTIGEVDEIELATNFFDYEEKYTLKTANIHMPARIRPETAERIKHTAAIVYRTLGCRGFARVDLFLTPDEEIVFNEVNTIPGFTSHSRYPNMLKGIGLTFEEIVNRLVELAVEPC